VRERELVLDGRCTGDRDAAPQLVDEGDEEQREGAAGEPGSNALGEDHDLSISWRGLRRDPPGETRRNPMNLWKIVALGFIAATVMTVGYRAASAQGAAACNNQPNMAGALGELRNARAELERAVDNKGGWRVGAIQQTETAIRETERGCAFANGQ
jgi:hypothetical protein